jgi:hypothetical protein
VQVKHKCFPVVIVHGLAHALAALAPGRGVTLLSARNAAGYAGCGWWRALVDQARAQHPETEAADILDCGEAAGRALEALRIRQHALILDPSCTAYAAVAAAAAECDALLLDRRPESLDLAGPGALRLLPEWLGTGPLLAHRQLR